MTVQLRLATEKDTAALLEIYTYYVQHTNYTLEFAPPTLIEYQQRISDISANFPYIVAEESGQLIGFAYAHEYKTRAAYNWTVEISIYVRHDILTHGVGTLLHHALEQELRKQNIVNLSSCITGGNERSIRFHEKMGYQFTANFKQFAYKDGQWVDVIWLTKALVSPLPDPPTAFIPYPQITKKL